MPNNIDRIIAVVNLSVDIASFLCDVIAVGQRLLFSTSVVRNAQGMILVISLEHSKLTGDRRRSCPGTGRSTLGLWRINATFGGDTISLPRNPEEQYYM